VSFSVIFMGPPGAGKGTQSMRLADRFGFVPINSGSLLRQEIAAGSLAGGRAAAYVRRGDLVPDEIVLAVMTAGIKAYSGAALVLDGYPKTRRQAVAVTEILADVGSPVRLAVDFVASREVLRRRLLDRGQRSGRADDIPETVKRRLDAFSRTDPELLGFWRNKKLLASVDTEPPEEIVSEAINMLVWPLLTAGQRCHNEKRVAG
jgi:adenylate kinase